MSTSSLLAEGRVTIELEAAPLVSDFLDIDQVTRDTAIDPNNINNSLLSMSGLCARYGLIVGKARIQRDGFKSRRGLMEAQLEKVVRDRAVEESRKVTNPQVASLVASDSRMVSAELNLNEASAILAACQETLKAIHMKRDMLIQLNKNQQAGWDAAGSRVPIPTPEPANVPIATPVSTLPLPDAISTTSLPEEVPDESAVLVNDISDCI